MEEFKRVSIGTVLLFIIGNIVIYLLGSFVAWDFGWVQTAFDGKMNCLRGFEAIGLFICFFIAVSLDGY